MKIKYLKTENATITIEYSSYLLKKILEEINIIEEINFERINIECKATDLSNINKILNNHNIKIPIFIKVHKYNNKYESQINELNKNFYIIIVTNLKEFKLINYNKDYYYEIITNYKECKDLVSLLNDKENIIININTFNLYDSKKINDSLTYIVNNTNNKYLYFENLFIGKDLIYKCPYNIYLNNSNSNRKYGNNIPRNIYIDKNYNVYAIKIKNKNLTIGNLKNNTLVNLLSNCKKTDGYKNFKNYNKILFFELLDQCPFNTIDYISYLDEVIKND